MSTPAETTERNYIAFISYRHLPLDREAAVRIQKKIENYSVPKEFRDRTGGSKKLGVCFRDEDELPASSSLSDSITYALDHTEYLIVICTPDLPKSRWCLAEVDYFLKTHDRDHVLAVLADGEPDQSFPEQLRFVQNEQGGTVEIEPLAANIAGADHKINNKTFKKEVTRLIAAMLGCPFDALWQRERRARTNRLLAAMGAGIAVMAVIMGLVLSKNAQISRQNEQISEQNQTITAKNRELEQKMSTALVDSGLAQLQNYDRKGALQSALDALESDDPEIYDHRVEKLLTDALGAYAHNAPQYDLMMTQSTDIERLAVTGDGRTALVTDKVGNVRALDVKDGTVCWDAFLGTSQAPYLYPVGTDLVLCKAPEMLVALSAKDGSELWRFEFNLPNSFQTISDDGTLFAVLDSTVSNYEYYSEYGKGGSKTVDMNIHVLDTATGETLSTLVIPDDPYHIYLENAAPIYKYGGDFSDDNSCFAAALPADTEDGTNLLVFKGDLSTKQVSCIGTYGGNPDMILGMALSANKRSSYIALTDNKTLYSVIMYEDPEKESDVTDIDYSMSSTMGIDSFDYSNVDRPFLPMLTSDDLVMLFSRNDVYVIERSSGTKRFSLDLDSPIVTACWLDRDKEHLQLLTQKGTLCYYDLNYGTGMLINDYRVETMPVTDISVACRCYKNIGGTIEDYLLAVPSAQPGHLLNISSSSDAGFVSGPSHSTNCAFAVMTPSKERVMYFFPVMGSDDDTLVEVVDVQSGELLESVTISLSPVFLPVLGISSRPLAVDNDHFLVFGALYGLDGSVTLMDSEKYRIEYFSTVRQDGTFLYSYETDAEVTAGADSNPVALACWIDGDPVEGCKTLEGGIVMDIDPDDTRPHYAVGKNGWIAGWGSYMTVNKDSAVPSQDPVASEKTMVVVQDTKTGEKAEILDDLTGVSVSRMVFANQAPYLACAYENGAVALYDLREKSSRQLSASYAAGEVQDLCFSDTDEHLLVLTVNGRVDCFRVDTGQQEASLPHCFTVSDSDWIDWFSAAEDPENSRLILIAANETGKNDPIDYYKAKYWTTVVDTVSWETTAQPDNVCFWSVRHGQAVIAGGKETGVCKAHTLKDLAEWARSELN